MVWVARLFSIEGMKECWVRLAKEVMTSPLALFSHLIAMPAPYLGPKHVDRLRGRASAAPQ